MLHSACTLCIALVLYSACSLCTALTQPQALTVACMGCWMQLQHLLVGCSTSAMHSEMRGGLLGLQLQTARLLEPQWRVQWAKLTPCCCSIWCLTQLCIDTPIKHRSHGAHRMDDNPNPA